MSTPSDMSRRQMMRFGVGAAAVVGTLTACDKRTELVDSAPTQTPSGTGPSAPAQVDPGNEVRTIPGVAVDELPPVDKAVIARTNEIGFMDATTMATKIASKELSPVEVMRATLDRVATLNPVISAYLFVDEKGAMAAAKAAEEAVMRGDALGPLHGVPVGIKDNVDVTGMPTTNGFPLGSKVAEADGIGAATLRKAGAVFFGKTNLNSFAHKAMTDNLLAPPCRNPWNLEMTPGGSSGGAAASLAAGITALQLGNDGGGSIRVPSALTGIFGLKPSVGRVPDPGSIGSYGLAHEGPMTRTVADAALMMSVIAVPSSTDYLSVDQPVLDYRAAIAGWQDAIRGLKVAFTPDMGWGNLVDPELLAIVEASAKRFADLGCTVETVNPEFDNATIPHGNLYYGMAASKGGKLLEEHPEAVDFTLRDQILEGQKLDAAAVAVAMSQKLKLFGQVNDFFTKYDLLLSPATAVPAWPIDQQYTDQIGGKRVGDTYTDRFECRFSYTPIFNLTGHPACSVPVGFTTSGLPVGMQIAGPWHADLRVLQAAAGWENLAPWQGKRPPLVGG